METFVFTGYIPYASGGLLYSPDGPLYDVFWKGSHPATIQHNW